MSEPVRLGAPAQPAEPSFDRVLLWAVLALTALGLAMVYSASAVMAGQELGDSFHFLRRQLVSAGIGLAGMLAAMRWGYKRLELLAYPVLALALVALLLVLVPGVGAAVKGAQRWIRLGTFAFQPAELAKLAMVLYLARSLARKGEKIRDFSIGFVPHVIVAGLFALLLLAQPDFGSAATIFLLLCVMLFCAGARLSWFALSAVAALPLGWYLVFSEEYRRRRMTSFLDPWAHRNDEGWQLVNSLLTLGSGGVTGQGLGAGKQKLFYLPEAHTDFIVAVIGEELGFLGVLLVLGLFAVIVWRGVRAAYDAQDAFGAYLALGITALLGLQALVNLLVAMGLLPTKGLTLPFVSYGGTSLVLSLTAAGVLLAISGGRGGFLRPQRSARG